MAWVLAADDRLVDLPDSSTLQALGLGQEVPANLMSSPGAAGGGLPGILVGRGPGANPTPERDQATFPPTRPEVDEIIHYARELGNRLSAGPHFGRHFRAHRNLMERTTGGSITSVPARAPSCAIWGA